MDLEASARKVEEHRSHLEKRLGSGDIPPKTAEEYKLTVPESMADKFKAEDFKDDPMLKAFMTDAHAAGLSQKQVDMVIGQYLERLPAIGGAMAQMSVDQCTAALKETWTTDADYKQNLGNAFRAARAYGGGDFEAVLSDYGNDPRIIKMLASIGKELPEDTGAPAGARGNGDAQTMKDEHAALAAWVNNPANQKSLEFQGKNRRYNELSQAIWGNQPRRSAGVSINTL